MNKNTIIASLRALAIVSATFSVAVSILLLVRAFELDRTQPLDSPTFTELRSRLSQTPSNDIRQEIRELDKRARKTYFTSQAFFHTGGYLLLAGIIVSLASLKLITVITPPLPDPGKYEPSDDRRARTMNRRAVALGALLLLLAIVAITLPSTFFSRLHVATPAELPASTGPDYASDTEMQNNWPCFRGPYGLGIAYHTNAPVSWDAEKGSNLVWKAAIPLPGFSSPVVWKDRIFLTGGNKESRDVLCYNAEDGALLWRKPEGRVPGSPGTLPEIMAETSFAPSTMATDGRRVFAIFPTGNVVAHDMQGTRLWARHLGVPENTYGYASSLITCKNLLLVQYENSNDPRIIALDTITGKTEWESVRLGEPSWASPALIPSKRGFDLIVSGTPEITAFNTTTGEEIWTHDCMSGEIAPSPAYYNGFIYSVTDPGELVAVKIGDTPETAWTAEDDLPDVSSPLAFNNMIITATSSGTVTARTYDTGDVVWKKDFPGGFHASPVAVGNRIYLTNLKGTTYCFLAQASYQELGQGHIGEQSSCTAAFVNGRVYIRGEKNLLCIGK